MTKQIVKAFNGELNKLFEKRIHSLKSIVANPTKGKPPKLTKSSIDKSVILLQLYANSALINEYYKQGYDKLKLLKKQWHIKNKGWGREAKIESIKRWYDTKINWPNNIYVFCNKRKCLYVGRTLNGKGRPQTHFKTYWLGQATRVDIYHTSKKRDIPKLECLAWHKNQPTINKNKPSIPKGSTKCPICKNDILIKNEIKSIFGLK